MESHNCWKTISVALVILTVFGVAAVQDVEADVIVCFPLDTDPGWSTQGQWAFGIPLGGGSHCSDPTSGYTGTNVYGYNLAGDYTNNMPAYRLTTTALNCSGYENVTLTFWRWLGVESATFDHATVEVSNDGSNWSTVWSHIGSGFCDGAWIECIYDISAVADEEPTVYVRWTMGPTDSSVTYPGWNIDDICFLGEALDDMSISPSEGLTSSGFEGGPFTPPSKTYSLTNDGPNSLDWTAAAAASWLDIEPNFGILGPGESNSVTVSFNANASALPQGIHNDTVTFTNTISGITQTRDVMLEVFPAGTIFFDTFPSTTLNAAKWTICTGEPTVDDVGIGEPSPPYSLRLNGYPSGGDCVESRVLNLSGMAGLEFTYWYQRRGGGEHPDPGEDLILEYWDGSTWVELDRQLGGGLDMTDYNEVMLSLPSGAYHANFKLRVSNIATSGNYDDWFVDDIWIIVPDDLSISPAEDFNSFGYEGGPFTPACKQYTLTNIGANSLGWTAAATVSWLDIEPNSGTLAPGGAVSVTVCFNSDANALPPGSYSDIVTFTNTTSGFVQRRNVRLQVIAVPGEIEVTDSIPPVNDLNMPFGDAFIGPSWTENITITNTNPNYSLIITDISLGGLGSEYFEDFEDGLAQDWDEDVDQNWEVVSGEYRAQSAGYDFMFSRYLGQEWEELSVQMSCRRDGSIYKSAAVLLRASSDFDDGIGSGYVFQIATDGDYSIWKQVSGSWSWLQSWTASGAINAGTNILRATAQGDSMQFFINDTLVWSGTDSALTSGHIGLGGFTEFGDTTHYFDDVLVAELEPTSQTISPEQQWYNEHPYQGGGP
ncbi:MAG: BACON domain-containing protein, partial [Planctomycetota bacterium]